MRVTSIAFALMIVGGLYYWFVARHETEAPATALSVEATSTVAENEAKPEQQENADVARRRDAPVPVAVMTSRAQETTGTLIVRGRTAALRNVAVAAQTSGRVISEDLFRGARVAKGDVLCRLEPGVRAAELAEAEAALAEAAAEAGASNQLSKRGFAAEMTVKTRQAQLQAAEARLDRVRWDIEQLEIKAPFDGVLETDTAELGMFLSPGNVCATVIDLSMIKIVGFVAESEVDLLSVGQPTKARLINGVVAEGRISFLSRMADERTRTFGVEVTLDNPDGLIRDGMTAELVIALPPRTAHLIPQSALTLDDSGRLGVRIDRNGIARFVPVDILNDTPAGVWIGGLPEEASIIVVGQEFVRDGRKIAAVPAEQGLTQ